MRLFRTCGKCQPPFRSPTSWSDNLATAGTRRAQRVVELGFGPIWQTDVDLESVRFLDARKDASILRGALGRNDDARLRDIAHEGEQALSEAGWDWVAFDEPDQPGAEYIYLAMPELNADEVLGE